MTEIDSGALASLEQKLHLVRDLVKGVARGYKTGLYLYGHGGVGKSYTVLQCLQTLKIDYRLYNSRMTGKGLFLALERDPDAVHVLEDLERLAKDLHAQSVLRAALWAQPGHERVVTWTTATGGFQRFTFRGGIIMTANRPLADLPELRAMATRIEVHRLDATDRELSALMLDLAGRGYKVDGQTVMGPEACLEVTEQLLTECRDAGCPLDLRLQQKSFQTYRQWEAHHTSCHWQDILSHSVREAAAHFRYEVDTGSPEDQKRRCRNVVRAILAETGDGKKQERLYRERTGRSRADFFRRKREVESPEFDGEA
jgi:hypothetical protein